MKAYLQLENGVIFEGKAFGNVADTLGEVVFNTGMTGYQEIITDPSYYGQIVVMTYPLIGNYGINLEDSQSKAPQVKGLVVREKAKCPNNFRCELNLDGYLKYHKVMGIEGIDTRQLTKIIREKGTMKGIITTKRLTESKLQKILNNYDNNSAVHEVSTEETYSIDGTGKHIAIIDFGIKNNIIESFKNRGLKITVFPSNTTAERILSVNPDGIFLSNGPGNPKDYPHIINNIKILIENKPTIGICLGHQLIALALGGNTEKLKFGHRGCNHPVKDLKKDKVYITSQNHGYVVSKIPDEMEVTHINLNDNTVEGLKHKEKPLLSVQFHPEASPGPDDAHCIFDEFMELI
ncbi:MAG: carbamoyl phosphate synthase small subunit [Eubacteriaceae bacterium]